MHPHDFDTKQNQTEKPPPGAHPQTVVITGISHDAVECDVGEVFEKCGPLVHVRIVRDKSTGKSKGVALCQFVDSSSVLAALELDESISIKGGVVRVERSTFPAIHPYQKRIKKKNKAGKGGGGKAGLGSNKKDNSTSNNNNDTEVATNAIIKSKSASAASASSNGNQQIPISNPNPAKLIKPR